MKAPLSSCVGGSFTGLLTPAHALLLAALWSGVAKASPPPQISSFSPPLATPGSTVNIFGLNFGAAPSNNIVYFGAARATVTAAGTNSLSVLVPGGATYSPITETVAGLTSAASSPFWPTFSGTGVIDNSTIAPRVDISMGAGPARIIAGDIDGDGKPDLVVAQSHDSTVWVFRNISTNSPLTAASFDSPVILSVGGAQDSLSGLTLADLDGDGRLDIVAVDYLDNKISVFQNLAAPGPLTTNSFGSRIDLVTGASPRDAAAGDLDGDGRPDLVVANYDSSSVSIIRNISTPGILTTNSFAPEFELASATGAISVAVGDVDGDGKLDIVVAAGSSASDMTSIFRNVGSPGSLTTNSFAGRVDFAGGGDNVALGDLDRDGKLDVAVGSWSKQVLSVFRNTGVAGSINSGSFAARVDYATGANVHRVAIADLDGDGVPDIALACELPSQLSLFHNSSTPGIITTNSFGPRVDYPTGWNAHALTIADLDGDGKPDIALVALYDALLELYHNSTVPPVPPGFTVQPENRTVNAGATAIFIVTATGVPPPTYQWMFNGTNIAGATNSSLVLTNVQASQAGTYSVLLLNLAGALLSSNVILTVITPCQPAPAGLISWWAGEGNASDSVLDNNGTPLNGVGFAAGMVGSAFAFNGPNECVQIPWRSSLAPTTFSVEAWIEPSAQVSDPANQWLIFGQSFGRVQLVVRTGTSNVLVAFQFGINHSTFYDVVSTNEIPIGQFSHLVGTWDGTTLSLYINGVLNSQRTPGAVPVDSGCPYFIGGFYSPGTNNCSYVGQFFQGLIDEVSYYNRALTPAEVQSLYAAGSVGKCPLPPVIIDQPNSHVVNIGDSASFTVRASGTPPLSYQWLHYSTNLPGANSSTLTLFNIHSNNLGEYSVSVTNSAGRTNSRIVNLTLLPLPACASPPAGIVSWWRAETNTLDSWGTNNGTIVTVGLPVSVGYSPGKVGQGFSPFNGSYVDVPDNPSLRLTNALTIESWVYPTGAAQILNGTVRTILSKFDPITLYRPVSKSAYYLGTLDNRVFLRVTPTGSDLTNTTLTTTAVLPTNQWSFIAATYDGAALSIYINGILATQTNYADGIFPGTNDVGIGAVPSSSPALAPQNFWAGILDEVTLYNRALSPAEILGIYNAGSSGKCPPPPVITTQPQNQFIPLGEDVLFSVSAVGPRPFYYQWRHAGTNLPAATNSTLLIERVNTNNAGFYSVIVSNSFGTTTSTNALLYLQGPPACVATPPGLISWWPADGYSTDAMGTNNVSFVTDGFYAVTGKVNQAWSFNGANSRIQAANSPSLNFGSNADFSIEGWIKALPTLPTGGNGYGPTIANVPIVNKRTSSFQTNGIGYMLSLYQGQLACWLGTTPGAGTNVSMWISSSPDLRDSMFHHVALTLSRSSTNGGNLYVDGQTVLTFDPTARNGSLANDNAFIIGSPATTITITNSYFRGLIDELSIYNRALTPAEVLAIRQADWAGKCKVPPSIITQPVSQRGNAGANVTFSVSAAGSPRLNYQWTRNGTNIVGATNANYTFAVQPTSGGLYAAVVTNVFGRAVSSNALLTVHLPPVALCTNPIVPAGTPCQAFASVDAGSFDPDGEPITLIQMPPGPYYLGSNHVTLIVTDSSGASASCNATVLVQDATPPSVSYATNITVTNDLNQCGAMVNYPLPVASDNCSGVTVPVCVPPPGSFFPVGVTAVQCVVRDVPGNATNFSFTVTVLDVQSPSITCPADIIVTNAHDAWTSIVTFAANSSDNCAATILYTPSSGSAFGLGTNVVTCSALDPSGNANQCTFVITVLPGNKPPVPAIAVSPLAAFPGNTNLIVIASNNSNAPVVFDGSKSYDPDGDTFSYAWSESTNLFSTNMVATNWLAVGTHTITLSLDDTFPLGTNSATMTVQVITPAQSVALLIEMVGNSALSKKGQQPLQATLHAAAASFDQRDLALGISELRAFQNKVRAQVAPSYPDLAAQLVASSQVVINALGP